MAVRDVIARAIAGERTAQALTQADLAARAGVSPGILARIEAGTREVTLDELLRLAQALDVTGSDLLRKASPHDRARFGL
ncbi:helix-turn-helix transcriptional regulator [Kineosporia sp. NBRC 101731]|uniref:helix-turn-helix domain-containing protein n=1 Tax=Kineosporia sp. NBRC 101731 TaxID=3032199 RepID=UPI00255790B1|nr:helix-turn-helix transcriptional regulator [Kineosporia sp. NBRC 101731]